MRLSKKFLFDGYAIVNFDESRLLKIDMTNVCGQLRKYY